MLSREPIDLCALLETSSKAAKLHTQQLNTNGSNGSDGSKEEHTLNKNGSNGSDGSKEEHTLETH